MPEPMPWGQDYDEWQASKPAYNGDGHQLGYNPDVHSEGKGFVLEDGSLWTWPTHEMRPQHLEYNCRARKRGVPVQSGTAFHIDGGRVYMYGPGRKLTPELQQTITQADPRLWTDEAQLNIPKADAPKDFGHGYNVLDILERKDRERRANFENFPNVNQWSLYVGGPEDHEYIRDWFMQRFPNSIPNIQPGLSQWAGEPDNSNKVTLFDSSPDQVRQIVDEYGRSHPHEEAFGVEPHGAEGFVYDNPHSMAVPEQGAWDFGSQDQLFVPETWEPRRLARRVFSPGVEGSQEVPAARTPGVDVPRGRPADYAITARTEASDPSLEGDNHSRIAAQGLPIADYMANRQTHTSDDNTFACVPGRKVAGRVICAHCSRSLAWDKLSFNYKKLKREKYFNTPEGRAVLEILQRRYPRDPRVLNWLLREYRRGRLAVSPQWLEHVNMLLEGEQAQDQYLIDHANRLLDDPNRPDIVLWQVGTQGALGHPEPVQPGMVQAIGQMMDQGFRGKGVDIMNYTFGDFLPLYADWTKTRRKHDPGNGEIVHALPNGWTIRRLRDKGEAYLEGEDMQNCVPKFAPAIKDGTHHIFSLRDPKNRPHANVLISPRQPGGHWEGGVVRDVRGKQNDTPKDEYAEMLRHWFERFNEAPSWRPDPGPPGDAGPGHPEMYGLGQREEHYGSFWEGFTDTWDFGVTAAIQKTANAFNKVRNMLRKNNIFDTRNELYLEGLRSIYGMRDNPDTGQNEEHDEFHPYAEWLHREMRKGRLRFPYDAYIDNIERHKNRQKRREAEILELEYAADQLRDWIEEARRRGDMTQAEDYMLQLRDTEYSIDISRETMENAEQDIATYTQYFTDPRSAAYYNIPKVANPETGREGHELSPEILKAFRPVLQRRKGRGEEANIMKIPAHELVEEAKQHALMEKLLKHGGQVVHEYPDGWTLRRITDGQGAKLEGELMGHCIDQYVSQIEAGTSLNYSLRDPKGFPHVTFEIKPTRPAKVDWDTIYKQSDLLHNPAICPQCGGQLDENAECTNCGHKLEINDFLLDYTPNELYHFEQFMDAGEDYDPYAVDPNLNRKYQDFRRGVLQAGLGEPDPREGNTYQIQGKGNIAPESKYHKYIKDWALSFSPEERPRSAWSSYFRSKPVMYAQNLDEATLGVDEFGFAAPNREIDWEAVANSLAGQQPKLTEGQNKYFLPPELKGDEQYRPELGQKAYEFARDNGHLRDFYRAINEFGKVASGANGVNEHGHPQRPNADRSYSPEAYATCPHGHTDWHRSDGAYYYCEECGDWRLASDYRAVPVPQGQSGPNYTPYQAAAVQHLGSLFAQHDELQDYAQHDAPEEISPTCPRCQGPIGTCPHCPSDTHGICQNCGGIYYYPQRQAARNDCPYLTHDRQSVQHYGPNGDKCYCLFHESAHIGPNIVNGRTAATKIADKLNKFLLNPQARPDLQTPEAQQFLQHLQQNYHNERTDDLMPWLTREWKKGRVWPVGGLDRPGGALYFTTNPGTEFEDSLSLPPDYLNHIADWYHSDHPTRRGVDIMQLKAHDLHDKIKEWDEAMKAEMGGRAATTGEIVHHYGDGWTMQRLHEEPHLKEEGDKMGHCVGGYGPSVRNGHALIYSLRDDKNEPHTTIEIRPKQASCAACGLAHPSYHLRQGQCPSCDETHTLGPIPHGGEVVQIQGKANTSPLPEYQQRVKEWVQNTFTHDELPTWDDQFIDSWDELTDGEAGGYTTYHDGDYGLNEPHISVNWGGVVESMLPAESSGYSPEGHPSDVVDKAVELGQLDELDGALDIWQSTANRAFRKHVDGEFFGDPASGAAWFGRPPFEESWESRSEADDKPATSDFACQECDGDGTDDDTGETCAECGGQGFDQDEYDSAYDQWERAREEYYDDLRETIKEEEWDSDPRGEFYDTMQGEIFTARRHMRRAKIRSWFKRSKPPKLAANLHKNYSTGQPCTCGFRTHLAPFPSDDGLAMSASSVLQCRTCGDPMDGPHCKRCDWGFSSDAPGNDAKLPSVKRDFAEGIQAKVAAPPPEDPMSDQEALEALRDAGLREISLEDEDWIELAKGVLETVRDNFAGAQYPEDLAAEAADSWTPVYNRDVWKLVKEVPELWQEVPQLAGEEPTSMMEQARTHIYEILSNLASREVYRLQESNQGEVITHPCPGCGEQEGLSLDGEGDWRCSFCDSAWANTGEGPDIDEADLDIPSVQNTQPNPDQINPNEMAFFPEEWTRMDEPDPAQGTVPQFIDPAQREQIIYQALQEANQVVKGREGVVPTDVLQTWQNQLSQSLVQRGIAPDVAEEVSQEWAQQLQRTMDAGNSGLYPPQEWTARVAARYANQWGPVIPQDRWQWS